MSTNGIFLPMRSRRVLVLCFPGAQTLDITGPAEVFAYAGRLCSARGVPAYRVLLVSGDGGDVVSTSAISISTRRLRGLRVTRDDTVLVSGGPEGAVTEALRDARLVRFLESAARTAERTGSVCSGAFLLAAAGLLDGRRAATHWSACERLAKFRPQVTVDADAIFVEDGAVWTSAGVTTGIDMALAIVERDHGRALANAIAAQLVLYVQRPGSQSQFSAALVAQTSSADPMGAAVAWTRAHLDTTPDAMAHGAGMSLRTFHRRCLEHLNLTPAKLLDRLRVEHARMLLTTTSLSSKEIANESGFSAPARMAAAFRREMDILPSTYRLLFEDRGPRHTAAMRLREARP